MDKLNPLDRNHVSFGKGTIFKNSVMNAKIYCVVDRFFSIITEVTDMHKPCGKHNIILYPTSLHNNTLCLLYVILYYT